MSLREAIGLGEEDEFDPSSPFALYDLPLGTEAAELAAELLAGQSDKRIRFIQNDAAARDYLAVQEATGLQGEICRLTPINEGEKPSTWPTAAELALVHLAHSGSEEDFAKVVEGEIGFCLYDDGFPLHYLDLAQVIRKPEVGPDNLSVEYASIIFTKELPEVFCRKVMKFLSQSFDTRPIKYRFIEVYRIFESTYLRDAYDRFKAGFFKDPEAAISSISSTIKNERSQLYSLVEPHQKIFEDVADAFENLKASQNKFAWAINKSIESKYKGDLEPKWKKGASLVYAVRCAIVHAGEKDVVFESFEDGDIAVEEILPALEIGALCLAGVEML